MSPLSEKKNRQKNRRKNRQIGGADQKKHMVVEFFNTSWRTLMGIRLEKHIISSDISKIEQNSQHLRKKIVKKNRQIGADGADGRLCRQKINVTTRYRLIG